MSLTILIASHKKYWMPGKKPYLPIEVGAFSRNDLRLGGVRDNELINISEKNPNFCELTALYWAWKNLPETEDIGLVHYRRYFGRKNKKDPKDCIFSLEDFEELLSKAPVIVPPKRNYFIETVRSQYEHAHHKEDLELLEQIIKDRCPAYLPAFTQVMSGKKTHILNMFVMKRPYFDRYCEWLFGILFELEKKLDISSYNQNDSRVFGFLSERLLDVWLITEKVQTVEAPLVLFEKVNWIKKGTNFLMRKFGLKAG